MKFNLEEIPEEAMDARPKVGDMYAAKGGRGDTKVWLVAAVRGETMHMLGLTKKGEIVSTSSFGAHAMEYRPIIGFSPEFRDARFKVSSLTPTTDK